MSLGILILLWQSWLKSVLDDQERILNELLGMLLPALGVIVSNAW